MKTNWTTLPVSEFLKLTVADVLTLLGVVIPTEEQPQEPPKEEEPPIKLPPIVEEPAPVEPPPKEEPPKESTPQPTPIEPVPDEPPVELPPSEQPPQVSLKKITTVTFKSLATETQYNVPVTFGQVFAEGDLAADAGVALQAADGSFIECQMDVKAKHPDGSVRHAVLSAILPVLNAVSYCDIVSGVRVGPTNYYYASELRAFDTSVAVNLDGVLYHAYYDTYANYEAKEAWLDGYVVTEKHYAEPFKDASGNPHPHLHARFASRVYATGQERIDISIENDWAYEPSPQNFTYDVVVKVADKVVFERKAFTHLHHSRYRILAWTGEEPKVHVMHNTPYLIGTRAFPNYDLTTVVPEKESAAWDANWKKAEKGPMNVGLSFKGMRTTGGRPDIGILPEWSASYLLTMDERVKAAMDGTADCAGSWSMHYRDKDTGKPVSLIDYPYMTILGRSTDTKNPNRIDPVTKKKGVYEAFPALVKGKSETPYQHDSAHQPGFTYTSYLVSGDHYYLEELQFWAMWNIFSSNPGYRKNIRGLVMPDQVRGQGWSLRTLAQVAYITPDDDRLKEHFWQILLSNLQWYNETYTYGTAAEPLTNKLGIFTHKSAVVYKDSTDDVASNTAVAPFQIDFVAAAVGVIIDLFPHLQEARDLLGYLSKFTIGRLTDPEFNWIVASNYTLVVRATDGGPVYETFGEVYRDTVGDKIAALPFDQVAEALGRKPNDMGGYPTSPEGFSANMQPAVAYAADYCGEEGKKAWEQFMKRSPKPNYGTGPQFAIVPRSM